jgi:hypothetical protein
MKREAVLMADQNDIDARYPQKEMLNRLHKRLVNARRSGKKLAL